MNTKQKKVYTCSDTEGAVCKKDVCLDKNFDPRSYCHSICTKPEHICGRNTCNKFIRVTKSGGAETVCIPESTCEVKKWFGPTYTHNANFNELDTETATDEDDSRDDNVDNLPIGDEKNTKDILKSFKHNLDPSGMAAVSALAGAEICPCCNCKVCQCKLKDFPSAHTLETSRQALAEKRLKKTNDNKTKIETQTAQTYDEKSLGQKKDFKADNKVGKMKETELKENREGELKLDLKETEAPKSDAEASLSDYFHNPDLSDSEEVRQSEEIIAVKNIYTVGQKKITENFREERNGKVESKLQETQKKNLDKTVEEQSRQRMEQQIERTTNNKMEAKPIGMNEDEIVKMDTEMKRIQVQPATAEGTTQFFGIQQGKDANARSESELVSHGRKVSEDNVIVSLKTTQSKAPTTPSSLARKDPKVSKNKHSSENQSKNVQNLTFLAPEGLKPSANNNQFLEKQSKDLMGESSRSIKERQKVYRDIDPHPKNESKQIEEQPKAGPEESHFYGKHQAHDLTDGKSTTKGVPDRVEGWTKETVNPEEWAEYKAGEWAGIEPLDEETKEEGDGPLVPGYISQPHELPVRSTNAPQPVVTTGTVPILNLQDRAFNRTWLEDTDRKSVENMAEGPVFPTTKLKTQIPETGIMETHSTGDSTEPQTEPLSPDGSKSGSYKEKLSYRLSGLSSEGETKIKMKKIKPLESRLQYDQCDCLPGFCTCGAQHYTYKNGRRYEEFGMGFRPLQVDEIVASTKEDRLRMRKLQEEEERETIPSVNTSCTCIHSNDEIQISPLVSRIEVVAQPPPVSRKSSILVPCERPKYQRTLIIVKPEALKFKDVILRAIKKERLDVLDERIIRLTPEQVAEIYTENFGSAYFPLFVKQLSSAPILVLSVGGMNSIARWSKAIGPNKSIPTTWFYPSSIKRRFGVHQDVLEVMRVSDDFARAKTEIRYFFPIGIIEPIIIRSIEIQDYCDKYIHPTLLKGLYKLITEKPVDPLLFLAKWLLINNPYQPFYNQMSVSLART